ncbi:UNVERIFIED_CONTAM: hypothetical protein RMT77_005664 [Armadillidium vulgare]
MQVPEKVLVGNSVNLVCEVDFGGKKPFSLTWWKDKKQFFQYRNRNEEPKIAYKVDGITIDLANSTMEMIALKNVTLQTSGEYECQLISEQPYFELDSHTKQMTVIRTPDQRPQIGVNRVYYSPGEILVANCTTSGAQPPPNIEWLINDKEISSSFSKIISKESPYMGVYSRTSLLKVPVKDEHFVNGKILVSCSVFIKDVYSQLEHKDFFRTGFRAVAPSQKYSGIGNLWVLSPKVLLLSIWTTIIWGWIQALL